MSKKDNSVLSPQSSALSPQSFKYTPLQLLNLYYSDGQSTGNKDNKLWRKMNSLLSWDNILNRGYQADLCPLLYFIITKAIPRLNGKIPPQYSISDTIVPESILSQLKKHYNISLKRNIVILEELKKVIHKLKKQGIQVVVLKGGLLAENLYENIACRPMVDLDILVKDNDREKCYKTLLGMGYKSLPENHRKRMLHYSFYKDFMGEAIVVEVHHRLVKEVFMTKFDLEEIWTLDKLPLQYELVPSPKNSFYISRNIKQPLQHGIKVNYVNIMHYKPLDKYV